VIKKCFKGLAWLLLSIFILLTLIIILFCLMIGTDKGIEVASKEASKHVEGLSALGVEGNIFAGGIQMETFHFSNTSVDVNAKGVNSSWELRCALQKKFCLETLSIDELTIDVAPTEKKTDSSSGPIELPDLKLPIDASIDSVLISRLLINLPDNSKHEVRNVHLSAKTTQNGIDIENLSASYQDKSVKITGTLTPSGDYPLDMDIAMSADDVLPDSLPEGEGNQMQAIHIKLTDSVRNLAFIAATKGIVNATVAGTASPLDKLLPVDLMLETPSIGWPLVSEKFVAANRTRLSISGSINDYTIRLSTRLAGEQIPESTILLSGLVNTERALIPAISVDLLNGTATGETSVSWKDELNWKSQWNLQNIDTSIYRSDYEGILHGSTKASGSVIDGNWSLDLETANLSGDLQGYPFALEVIATKSLDDRWSIDKAILNNGRNRLNASRFLSSTI